MLPVPRPTLVRAPMVRTAMDQMEITDKIEDKNRQCDQYQATGLRAQSLARGGFGRIFFCWVAHACILCARHSQIVCPQVLRIRFVSGGIENGATSVCPYKLCPYKLDVLFLGFLNFALIVEALHSTKECVRFQRPASAA